MEYKVGDKVKVNSLDWYNANKNSEGVVIFHNLRVFHKSMSEFCGKVVTIDAYNPRNYYDIKEDGKVNLWSDEMFECLVERNGKTYPYQIGDRVILKGNNRCATITDLKYNSCGNLSYYIKIDNDKDISVDYPTNLLLPYDNVVKDVVDNKPQDKMVSLDKVCDILTELHDKMISLNKACEYLESALKHDLGYYGAADFVDTFRKVMEK